MRRMPLCGGGAYAYDVMDDVPRADATSTLVERLRQPIDRDQGSSRSRSPGSDGGSSVPPTAPPRAAQEAVGSTLKTHDDLSAATGADASPLSQPVRLTAAKDSAPSAPFVAVDLGPTALAPLTDWSAPC